MPCHAMGQEVMNKIVAFAITLRAADVIALGNFPGNPKDRTGDRVQAGGTRPGPHRIRKLPIPLTVRSGKVVMDQQVHDEHGYAGRNGGVGLK